MSPLKVGRFADGEVNVMVHENVRGKDVYIVQVIFSRAFFIIACLKKYAIFPNAFPIANVHAGQ